MGYYSDVAIVLKSDDYKKLTEYAQKQSFPLADFIEQGELNAPTSLDKEFVHLLWNGVKWHNTYGEFIGDFLKTLPSDDYEFLRIGEDYDDWEAHWGSNVCTLEYKREIDFSPL